ncbi:M20/M25/M40 family metallo-hydrolase [bacterium]|nr:M20/M25/M40 family metallo-hydrolase [bacterium]
MADYLLNFAKSRGIACHEDDAGKQGGTEAGNIIFTIGDGGDTLFLSHMDTARSTASVKPVLREDRITSDGQTVLGVDNRVGISTLLTAVDIISKADLPHLGFTVVFTICEESNLAGSRYLHANTAIKRGYAFDSSYRPGAFIIKAPGAKYFTVEVNGKASHSGIAPEEGVNALQIAARAVGSLPLGRIDDNTTMNIGPFHSDAATNVVPPKVELMGEIRSGSNARVEEIEKLVLRIFSQSTAGTEASFDYSSEWDFQPYEIAEDAPVRKHLISCLKNLDINIQPKASFGGSDANVLNAKGIPTINLGVGAQRPHSNDEFILYDDLMNTTKIALELMQNEN